MELRTGPFGHDVRRVTTILLALVLSMAIPVVVVAGACGIKAPCCKPSPAGMTVLERPSCCADTCVDTPRDTRTAADSAKQLRVERVDAEPLAVVESAALAPVAIEEEPPAGVPDLDRRLASLSILLI